MIYGNNFRPLVMAGSIINEAYSLGKVVKNRNIEEKTDYIQVISAGFEDIFEERYSGYVFENEINSEYILEYLKSNKMPSYEKVNFVETLVDDDIIEIGNEGSIIRVLYRADSDDNALVLTNQCNCNCIMCPDTDANRQVAAPNNIEKLKKLVRLIKGEAKYICITGGEPTLLKEDFLEILEYCKKWLPKTKFTLLTNGRMFYYNDFSDKFVSATPSNLIVGIPLHAHESVLYDKISGVLGSYKQVIHGINNLYKRNIKMELRIVVSNENYKILPEIAKTIIRYFPKVNRVNFMALEMLGNAILNKDRVWVDFETIRPFIKRATLSLLSQGIQTYFYNFPLCGLEQEFWSLSVNSITDHKVRYRDECIFCSVKSKCGGFFNSTINLKELKVKPINSEV